MEQFTWNWRTANVRSLAVALAGLAFGFAECFAAPAFTATGSLATPRDGFTATLLPNGKVLVAGGYDGTNQLSSAEVYDPATGRWVATGAMRSRRSIHTATLLPNGKVLVAGGYNGTNRVASTETYDATTGAWTMTGSLNGPRSTHSATLLRDGTVLIAGGVDDSTALGSAEIYNAAQGAWATSGSMGGSRATHTATLLPDGRVLVAGGGVSVGSQTAELYDPVTRTWTATGDMADSRSEHTATLLPNGQVLVAGGYKEGGFFFGDMSITGAELYDPARGTWTATGPLTDSRFGHTATLLPNGQVLVAGGVYQGFGAWTLSSAELYDPAFRKWSPAGNMTVSRLYHSATLLNSGRVLIASGFNYDDNDLSSAELYSATSSESSEGAWLPTGSLATARIYHTATLLTNGQVLVAGGWNGIGGDNFLASAERYDTNSGRWTATGDMNSPRQFHTATLLRNGLVLAAGGYDGIDLSFTTELYNPSTGSWTDTGWLNTARTRHAATLLGNGRVLVAGGYDGSASTSSAELYEPVTGVWSITGSMNVARESHTTTVLADGRVVVAGGPYFDGRSVEPMADAELYDPATETWTPTTSMATARRGHTATLLPNGKVLVVGGEGDSSNANFLDTAELYEPTTETWTSTGSLAVGRSEHTATLLANGKVLVAGGLNLQRSQYSLSSAELYDPAAGVWTAATGLNTGRREHTAVLLTNGQVLVAGGESHNISPYSLASAELYEYGAGDGPIPQPPTLTSAKLLPIGSFQFSFTNTPGAVFSVLATTFPSLPSSEWMVLGGVTETAPGQFRFTDTQTTNYPKRFYRVRSP